MKNARNNKVFFLKLNKLILKITIESYSANCVKKVFASVFFDSKNFESFQLLININFGLGLCQNLNTEKVLNEIITRAFARMNMNNKTFYII